MKVSWNVIRVAGAAAFAALAEGATVVIEKIARKREAADCDDICSWDEPECEGVDEPDESDEEKEEEEEETPDE